VANAPAPHGARRPPPTDGRYGGGSAGEWGESTSVRSGYSDTDDRFVQTRPPKTGEGGLPGWAALAALLAIAGVGGAIDSISGAQVRGGFNVGIVFASVVAILIVRRTAMFPIVIAPPLVYAAASAAMLYVRSGGLHDKKVVFDGAANWLVYGFPAIAAATAAVLIIAGIRLITHR